VQSDDQAEPREAAASAGQWAEIRTRIEQLEKSSDALDDEELRQSLETAHEELQVADEEVRVQQHQIGELLEGQHLLRWQHERMMAVLPVAVVMTDGAGIVRSVNAAAATLVRTPVARMVGKPVLSLFAVEDRTDLRRLLGGLVDPDSSFRRVVTVQTRDRQRVRAELTATRLPGAAPEISWMLVGAATERPSARGGHAVPDTLARLALVPTQVANEQEALTRAAALCAECLGDGVAVSISIGPPEQPVAVAATSQAAQAFDGAQISASQGPGLTAFGEATTVEARDVHRDARWPRLTELASPAVRGVVSTPLEVGEGLHGAFSAYVTGTWPPRLSEDVELLASTVAAVIFELGLKKELQQVAEDLRTALTSRATIDQAKGIVMADRGMDADAAFAHLVRISSTRHVKLRDVAQEIVDRAAGAR